MDFILFCLSNTGFQLISFQLQQELSVGAAAMSLLLWGAGASFKVGLEARSGSGPAALVCGCTSGPNFSHLG